MSFEKGLNFKLPGHEATKQKTKDLNEMRTGPLGEGDGVAVGRLSGRQIFDLGP